MALYPLDRLSWVRTTANEENEGVSRGPLPVRKLSSLALSFSTSPQESNVKDAYWSG